MGWNENKQAREKARLEKWARAHEEQDRRNPAISRSAGNASDQSPTRPNREKQLAVVAAAIIAVSLLSSVLTNGFAPRWLSALAGFSMFYLAIYAIWRASLRRKPDSQLPG